MQTALRQALFSMMVVPFIGACSADVAPEESTAKLELAATTTPIGVYPRATAVSEAGEPAFVSVSLVRQPRGPLTVEIVASNPAEVIPTPSRVTFKPNDWQSPRIFTLRAVDDASFDGDQRTQLSFRVTGPGCSASLCAAPPVEVLSVDDDYTVTGYVARDVAFGDAPVTGVSGLNHRGQVIGTFYNSQGIAQPFLWQDGVATEVGSLGGSGAQSFAVDINDAGVVLGWSDTPNGVTRFQFREGELTATAGEVWAINDRGHTVGDALYADGARTEVPALGNGPSEARGLNEKDHATGFGRPLPFGLHPFLWTGQELVDLGTLGGPAGHGLDINEHDQIVGWMHDGSIRDRPFLYDGARVIDLGSVTASAYGVASSINNRGDIVGSDGVRGAPEEGWVGRPGQLTALRSLLVDGSCFRIIDPVEVNDSGAIAARAWDCEASAARAVLLVPVKVSR